MQFETPQYIDVEDKIFGPFSWRQFLYLFGGIGIAIALFFMAPLIVFLIFGLPLALLGAALALYPFNNRPFSYFLEALFMYLFNNKLYRWKQRDDIVHTSMPEKEGGEFSSTSTHTTANPAEELSVTKKLELRLLEGNTKR